MNPFLRHMETDEVGALYHGLSERWQSRADALNARLENEGGPVRIANLGTIWTICYEQTGAITGCSNITCARRALR
jgi:glutamate-1-semialdehyde 2,1-aminomutase